MPPLVPPCHPVASFAHLIDRGPSDGPSSRPAPFDGSPSDAGSSPMRSSISSRDAPSRVQLVILSRMPGMRGTSWVGTKSAPRSCPLLVPDYGELQTLARLDCRPP